MSSMAALAFPDSTARDFAVNVLTVLVLYGPAYLANTGAMLFGKWIPDKTGFENHKIDGGRVHSDGNRLLGDGKSWEGLFGGGFFSGISRFFRVRKMFIQFSRPMQISQYFPRKSELQTLS